MYTLPLFASTECNLLLFASHCCKSFGLVVGGGVYDLWLPSASRIPDVSYYSVDPVFLFLSRFPFMFEFHLNSSYWLFFSVSYVQLISSPPSSATICQNLSFFPPYPPTSHTFRLI